MISPQSLGPWGDDDLADTAVSHHGVGVDYDLPDEVRFCHNVAKVILKRLSQSDSEGDQKLPAIFVLNPTPPKPVAGIEYHRQPMLDSGTHELCSFVWFVGPTVVQGQFVELTYQSDAQMFDMVTDLLGCASSPTIIFDPRPEVSELRYYPTGLGDAEEYSLLNLWSNEITVKEIFAVIDSVHENCLITPEVQIDPGKLWANQDKYWAATKAEAIVQLNIKAGLAGAFPSCIVRDEQKGLAGRYDLGIEENNLSQEGSVYQHAIIEVKALRERGGSGRKYSKKQIDDWIEEGVSQASAYAKERNAANCSLCCFDMRIKQIGDKCFAHVANLASELGVACKSWPIYATSKEYRDDQLPKN